MNKQRSYLKVYLAWAIAVSFFCYQYALRITPSLMRVELSAEFGISAEDFASLSAYYLYLYAFMQIPLGLLLDRLGVRKVVLGSVCICLCSILILANATDYWMVQLSRIFLGIGSACGFMCGLKVSADYLPRGKRGLLMGSTLAVGTIGASLGNRPILMLLERFEWREAMYWTMLPGAMILLLLLFVFPKHMAQEFTEDTKQKENNFSFKVLWESFSVIFTNYRIFVYALVAIGVYTPLAIIADLWGVDYLQVKYGFDRSFAALMNNIPYVGLMMGSFIVPWYADSFGRWNQTIRICSILVTSLFVVFIYASTLSLVLLILVLFSVGFFCGAEVTCFTAASRYVSAGNSGVVLGFVNTFNMLGGAILQHFVGQRLDFYWGGQINDLGVKIYTTWEYNKALSLLTVILVVCVLLAITLRSEKKKREVNH